MPAQARADLLAEFVFSYLSNARRLFVMIRVACRDAHSRTNYKRDLAKTHIHANILWFQIPKSRGDPCDESEPG